jgi:hypothetical protein|tara:strand:- start:102 stop:422 length:321 start_codon:yes stop_codon:yes gene_type:complete
MIKINNEIVCPMCRKITKFDSDKMLIDLPVNNILISIIDETSTLEIDNSNSLKFKKSKSVDSFVQFKKKKQKRNIFYTNQLKIINNLQNNNDNSVIECNRECCSFQ